MWQDAHALVLDVYKLAFGLPREEMYGLSAQIRRSASSIPASIAEGTGRGTQPELARFCRIANGSLNELEYHLLLARDLSYLPADAYVTGNR
ncbi:MAG: four helix bundle protein [Gemmatimonadota bacterium]